MTDPAALRTITIGNVDGDLVDEVRAALSAEVARAQRAATKAAAELVAETPERDIRSGALAIARSLATAARLSDFAESLLSAWAAGGPGLPPVVAGDLADEAAAAVTPGKKRRRTKAEIAADVAAQAAAAAIGAEDTITGPDAGEPPPAGASREEVIAATRAELDRLNGPEDEPPAAPETIPTLEQAARSIEAQGPKPEPGDRAGSDDVAEALSVIAAPEPAGA